MYPLGAQPFGEAVGAGVEEAVTEFILIIGTYLLSAIKWYHANTLNTRLFAALLWSLTKRTCIENVSKLTLEFLLNTLTEELAIEC